MRPRGLLCVGVNGIRRPLIAVLGIIALLSLALLVEVGRLGGVFRSVGTDSAADCSPVALGGSAEDIQVDGRRGLAYLSVLDRASVARGAVAEGSVMLLDLNLAEPAPRAALAYEPAGFQPHGLSLLERDDEPTRLFAVSRHAAAPHGVEIFEREPSGAFFPRQSVRDALFVHPNAVAAVGPRQFYVANDIARHARSPFFDALLRRGDSTVVYFDGVRARVVASGLRFASGIAVSHDGRRLYVAEALGERLRIYRRDTASGDISLEGLVALGAAPDNLSVDAQGRVWIAAHPRLFAFLAHLKDPSRRAPTRVLRYDPRDGQVTEVYESEGSPLSAGSVAAPWRDEFVVGAVLDHQVLICKTRS
jgi:arylesterase/paraoxonase